MYMVKNFCLQKEAPGGKEALDQSRLIQISNKVANKREIRRLDKH